MNNNKKKESTMIDRTMWFLYNKLGSPAKEAPSIDVISGMFFNYWKIMNALDISTSNLSAIDIYNGLMIKMHNQQQRICMNMVKYQQMQIIVLVITNKNTKYMMYMQIAPI
jgi:hypothetical protein